MSKVLVKSISSTDTIFFIFKTTEIFFKILRDTNLFFHWLLIFFWLGTLYQKIKWFAQSNYQSWLRLIIYKVIRKFAFFIISLTKKWTMDESGPPSLSSQNTVSQPPAPPPGREPCITNKPTTVRRMLNLRSHIQVNKRNIKYWNNALLPNFFCIYKVKRWFFPPLISKLFVNLEWITEIIAIIFLYLQEIGLM